MTDKNRTIATVVLAAMAAALLAVLPACERDGNKIQLPRAQAKPTAGSTASASPAAASAEASAPTPGADVPTGGDPAAPVAVTGGNSFSATTEPHRKTTVMARVGGPVVKVLVLEGDRVTKGQPVVQLGTEGFRLQLRHAQAARGLAQAQVDATRTEWKRLKGLVKDRAVPRSQFEQVDAQLKVGLAGLGQAEVAMAMANKALRDATVRAPYGGIVTRVTVGEGQWVATMPPTHLVAIEQIDVLDLRVQVPETALSRISEGTALKVRFSAVDRRVAAKVTRVVRSLDPRTRSFSAIAELKNADLSLRPGMFAEVRLAD